MTPDVIKREGGGVEIGEGERRKRRRCGRRDEKKNRRGEERKRNGELECGRSGQNMSTKCIKAKAELHWKVLSESEGQGLVGEREMCSVCSPDESKRDKEINCQKKPVNPE